MKFTSLKAASLGSGSGQGGESGESPSACNAKKPEAPEIKAPKKRGKPEPKSKADGNTDYW